MHTHLQGEGLGRGQRFLRSDMGAERALLQTVFHVGKWKEMPPQSFQWKGSVHSELLALFVCLFFNEEKQTFVLFLIFSASFKK